METAFYYLALSGILTLLLWAPYVVGRLLEWGFADFVKGYSEGFPIKQPEQSLWSARAQRAHLNMVETMPAFIAVIVAAAFMKEGNAEVGQSVAMWAEIFFFARIAHAAVYILGIPYIRTTVYLVSWLSVVMIGLAAIS